MDYIELQLTIEPVNPFAEIFMAALGEVGFESFVETEDGLLAYIQADEYQENIEETTFAWQLPGVVFSASRKLIPRVNWNTEWEKNFEPILVDDAVQIYAPFHEKIEGLAHNLLIEPKMSFGTGHHQTTHMMVQYTMQLDLQNKSVLDMGCGTGVLAILAAQRGAKIVHAIDIDDWAVENTIENAQRNAADYILAYKGGAEVLPEIVFDVILANINKHVLLADMHHYRKSLQPGGTIVFSGFYTEDLIDIEAAANAENLFLESTKTRNNWMSAKFVQREK